MKRRRSAALLAASFAALGLVACAPSKAAPSGPAVTSVSLSEATQMARQFCSDLASRTDSEAVSRMATRAAAVNLTKADQDAIVDYAATVCPKQF